MLFDLQTVVFLYVTSIETVGTNNNLIEICFGDNKVSIQWGTRNFGH